MKKEESEEVKCRKKCTAVVLGETAKRLFGV